MKDFTVKGSDVSVSGNAATVQSESLAESVKDNKTQVADYLSKEVAPIDPSKISIDAYGKVVINDPAFAKRLADLVASGARVASNFVCPSGVVC